MKSGPKVSKGRRVLLGKDPTVLAKAPEGLIDEALNYFSDAEGDGSIFMPTTRGIGRCHICGEEREMTKEHIPPATAFNRRSSAEHSLDEFLHREGWRDRTPP